MTCFWRGELASNRARLRITIVTSHRRRRDPTVILSPDDETTHSQAPQTRKQSQNEPNRVKSTPTSSTHETVNRDSLTVLTAMRHSWTPEADRSGTVLGQCPSSASQSEPYSPSSRALSAVPTAGISTFRTGQKACQRAKSRRAK